jgi:N-methylhydantoinase A
VNLPIADNDTVAATALGVDTGGTHTDVVLFDRGRLVTLKVPSTPGDLSTGILAGLADILEEAASDSAAIERFVYATTFVTNLIIEGVNTRVGLITTEGFRDVLEIGRASRKPHIYDIHWRPAPPLVPRALRQTVRERVGPSGEIIEPLDETGARATLEKLAEAGVESIAVCFFHAYANPAHERRVAQLAAEVCPQVEVSISSDVVREFREFERTSTTVVNALIKRPLQSHLNTLREDLSTSGLTAPAYIMRGNGGVSTFASASELPVALTHSGPMGGIIGGTALAKACGLSNVITLDMGGTSADISLIAEGAPVLTNRSHVGPYPLLVPMLDLITIGAGGGSMAWLDRYAALRVGPRSAGAVPGPACYGQGGTAATVTDCNLLAGRLNPGYFLDGRRRLDVELARDTLNKSIAQPLGLSGQEAALGIIAIAEAHMIDALRLVSVERGLDPRDFTLVAFGGAGPLHAVALADALGMQRVLIPPAPGNLSATGLVLADVRHDLVRTVVCDLANADCDRLITTLDDLGRGASLALDAERIPADRRSHLYSADLRYQGQNYEINIPLSQAMLDMLATGDTREIVERFNAQHRVTYGYQLEGRTIQIVNLRVTAVGIMPALPWPRRKARPLVQAPETRRVLLPDGEERAVAVYRFDQLGPGHRISGPAVVEYPGSTLFVAPGWDVEFDEMMNAHGHRGRGIAPDAGQGATP